ncbi:MAG: hypothetical protein HY288_05560 [Planctomycetia bacterium]|nr:hypothetical protein [Planctomycetia bacterium]
MQQFDLEFCQAVAEWVRHQFRERPDWWTERAEIIGIIVSLLLDEWRWEHYAATKQGRALQAFGLISRRSSKIKRAVERCCKKLAQ